MARRERALCILCLAYILAYGIFFFAFVWRASPFAEPLVFPLHSLGMALSLALVVVILRDIRKRSFHDPNAKVTWALLVVFANIFAIPVYLWKYGFKPRVELTGQHDAA
jgi:hypothetical protein